MSNNVSDICIITKALEENIISVSNDVRLENENLSTTILDLDLDLKIRVIAFEKFCIQFPDDKFEVTFKLAGMYTFSSGINLLHDYLKELCMKSEIEIQLKIILVKSIIMIENEIKKNEGYNILDYICSIMNISIPTPIRIETIMLLMMNDKFKNNSIKYFKKIINDKNIDCDFRYKTILNLEKLECKNKEYFLTQCCKTFLENTNNMTMFRILSGQYLLQNKNIMIDTKIVEKYIIDFAVNKELDYNLRADAADTILTLGSDHNKDIARDVIVELGRVNNIVRTIYDNAQNVHHEDFEKSVLMGLDFLNTISIKKINNKFIDFDFVEEKIKNMINLDLRQSDDSYSKKCELVEISLNRIFVDRTLFSKYNCTLLNILLKVWTYISSHKNREEMEQRLFEELIDMAGTCSSGFVSRLINVISGFGDFNFTMSWEDQICGNFVGRLNAKARNIISDWAEPEYFVCVLEVLLNKDENLKVELIKSYLTRELKIIIPENKNTILSFSHSEDKNDNFVRMITKIKNENLFPTNEDLMYEFLLGNNKYVYENNILQIDKDELINFVLSDFQAKVLEELPLEPSKLHERSNFLTFFRESMLDIMEEMQLEFKNHISDSDFDIYFRKAIIKYEGY